MRTITFTGHRPDKLYGYNLKNEKYLKLNKLLEEILEKKITEEGYNTFISGGALGFDTVAFLSIKNLKKKYPYIKNILAIPFENQDIKWSLKDRNLYNWMKSIADDIVYVDTIEGYDRTNVEAGKFHRDKLMIRNEYMVDNADLLIALWNNDKKSGTANCINYAKKKLNEPTLVINPETLNVSFLSNIEPEEASLFSYLKE